VYLTAYVTVCVPGHMYAALDVMSGSAVPYVESPARTNRPTTEHRIVLSTYRVSVCMSRYGQPALGCVTRPAAAVYRSEVKDAKVTHRVTGQLGLRLTDHSLSCGLLFRLGLRERLNSVA